MKHLLIVFLTILSLQLIGQDRGVHYEVKVGGNYTIANPAEKDVLDTNRFRIYHQDLKSQFGVNVSLGAGFPIAGGWEINSGLLLALSSLRHDADSKFTFTIGNGLGAPSTAEAKIQFWEVGIPLYLYRNWGSSRLGLGVYARYIYTGDVEYVFYNGNGEKADVLKANQDNKNVKNINCTAGLSFMNFPFSGNKIENLGWGADFKIYLLEDKLYEVNTPYRRMNVGLNLVYKL